jgi:hypothetical protein
MADLMNILEQEDVITREFYGSFTGPLTRVKVETTLVGEPPFPRSLFFVISNATQKWLVFYDDPTNEYWYELLTKAV